MQRRRREETRARLSAIMRALFDTELCTYVSEEEDEKLGIVLICMQRQAVAESWLSFNTILDASIKMSNPRVYRNSLNFPRPQKRSQENVTRVRILLN